ncbi:unnamed protein product [Orchesella dallaii]|uniref:Uncharacterized protein n=1 Tax=Orchesella dallaii TaxID=48710 RepID=A0ABP1RD01_9HEXA
MIDLEGQNILVADNHDGLTISLANGTIVECRLFLYILDTNNQPPIFSKNKVAYTIRSDWNKSIPLNVNFGDELQVTDEDFFVTSAVEIIPGEVIVGNVTRIHGSNDIRSKYTYTVALYLREFVPGVHVVTATDGVNNGSIEVEIIAENIQAPVFINTGYFYEFDSMPNINDPLPVKIVAIDPDTFGQKNISYNVTGGFMNYREDLETFVFTQIENLEGRTEDMTLMGYELATDGLSTNVDLSLKFPSPLLHNPRFPNPFYNIILSTWPTVGEHIADLNAELEGSPEPLTYQFGFNKPDFLGIENNGLLFIEPVSESQLGINNKIVFEVQAVVARYPTKTGSVTFVISFPPTGSSTTELTTNQITSSTKQPISSTQYPTTKPPSSQAPTTPELTTQTSTTNLPISTTTFSTSTYTSFSIDITQQTSTIVTSISTNTQSSSSEVPLYQETTYTEEATPPTEEPPVTTEYTTPTEEPPVTTEYTTPTEEPPTTTPTWQTTTTSGNTITTTKSSTTYTTSTTEATTSIDCKTPEECGLCSIMATCKCGLDEENKCSSSVFIGVVIATTALSAASTLLVGYLFWYRVKIVHKPFKWGTIIARPANDSLDNPRLSCEKIDPPGITLK